MATCTRCGKPITGTPQGYRITTQGGTRHISLANRDSKTHYHKECANNRCNELRQQDEKTRQKNRSRWFGSR